LAASTTIIDYSGRGCLLFRLPSIQQSWYYNKQWHENGGKCRPSCHCHCHNL